MNENTETVDGEGTDPDAESAVIRGLRADLKEAKAKLKSERSTSEEALATARAQVKRENEASQLMSNAGFEGLADIFATEVDGDLTAEGAAEWLKTRGLEASPDSGASADETAEQLAEVTDLGAQVASANQDLSEQGFTKKIDELEASTPSLDAFLEGLEKIEQSSR